MTFLPDAILISPGAKMIILCLLFHPCPPACVYARHHLAGECSLTVSLSHWTLKHSVQGPGVCIFASPMLHGAEHTLALSGHFWVHACPWKPLGTLEDIIKWTLIDNKQLPPLSVWCGLWPRFVASTVLLCCYSKVPWIFMLLSLRKTCPEQFFYAIK